MNLFVYGTLTFSEIVLALTGKYYKQVPAILKGYRVEQVVDRPYPALVLSKDSVAEGFVLLDVDREAVAVFDAWEGEEYRKQNIQIELENMTLDARTYIWVGSQPTKQTWNRSVFLRDNFDYYLEERIPLFLESK